ncbi:hypothetical protein HOLleu_06015 [Holothuria leucospilota]|uniref:Uncharacterized protein n=1 Tax=Holothuria leucospilota TaxID=206669 RepID=A0A9Q1CLI4_HOLLE|nr:hypothetical protein HOLleu_06015 [Holothuria leucospilota]
MNSPETQRWRVVEDCQQDFYFACQHIEEKNEWTVSDVAGPYEVTNGYCPYMYKFSLPTNGYMKQKLLEAAEGKPVWINYGPWLPGYVEPEPNFSPTTESKAVKLGISFFMLFIVCLVQLCTSHL